MNVGKCVMIEEFTICQESVYHAAWIYRHFPWQQNKFHPYINMRFARRQIERIGHVVPAPLSTVRNYSGESAVKRTNRGNAILWFWFHLREIQIDLIVLGKLELHFICWFSMSFSVYFRLFLLIIITRYISILIISIIYFLCVIVLFKIRRDRF